MIRRALLLMPCLLAVAGLSRAGDSVYELLDRRLELMEAVAAHKWHHDLAIEDAQRESVVLERAVEDALRFGLTPATSRGFFAAQIEAAKQIQRHWFAVWEAEGSPPRPADLEDVVRPELLRLGAEIVAAAAALQDPSRSMFERTVRVGGLDEAGRDAVFRSLRTLERFDHRLQQILSTGTLRVGTTGDYAPFSHREGDEAPVGIDMNLAHHLAAALEVEAVFVATSWPTLLEDLSAGRFDIAMSGVSRTLQRQKHGYLSIPYYAGGKTPIARCGEAGAYASLEDIDRRDVRVIVNPGGTNEQFVDTRIRRAEKILHEDNRTIFSALAAGEADVMITDRIEVELQAARRPELCATRTGTLTYQEKAYLMPRDDVWRAFVDTWLSLALADGTVAEAFHSHGVEHRLDGHGAQR